MQANAPSGATRSTPKASGPRTRPTTCFPTSRSPSSVRLAPIEHLPDIIRESVKPMERIEGIKIFQGDGLAGNGNGARRGGVTQSEVSLPDDALTARAIADAIAVREREPDYVAASSVHRPASTDPHHQDTHGIVLNVADHAARPDIATTSPGACQRLADTPRLPAGQDTLGSCSRDDTPIRRAVRAGDPVVRGRTHELAVFGQSACGGCQRGDLQRHRDRQGQRPRTVLVPARVVRAAPDCANPRRLPRAHPDPAPAANAILIEDPDAYAANLRGESRRA